MIAETDLDAVLATLEHERPEVCVIDSVQTLHAADAQSARRARSAQVREVAGEIMRVAKRAGHRGAARRPRDQGGRARRAARARAPRRLRAAVRGRARADLPHGARAQEPLRLDQRGRRLRDARRRPGRGARRLARASSPRRRARPGSVVLCAMEGSRPLLVEVQALVSPVRARAAAAGGATGSTATGSRSCWRCSAATPASAWAPPTCSSTSSAACASTSRARTSRWRWRSRARPGASRSAAPTAAPLACFGELGLTGELRTVAHADRRLAEAAKFGLGRVLEPEAHRTLRALRQPARATRRGGRGLGEPAPADPRVAQP